MVVIRAIITTLGFVISFVILPLTEATAGSISAVINGKSYHLDSTYDWNEKNYGAGVEYAFDTETRWRKLLFANGFRDSNADMSYMAGGGLHYRLMHTEWLSGLYVDAGLNAFVMTRQDVKDNRPFPGVLPSLSVGNRHMGFNLTYLPQEVMQRLGNVRRMDPTITGVLFLQVKFGISAIMP